MWVHFFLPIMENYSQGHFMPDSVLNGQAKAHSINTQLRGVFQEPKCRKVGKKMYWKHKNCMYLCYCCRCGFIFSCQSWKTIPTGILCQTRYWTDKPKLTASTFNSSYVWVPSFPFGGFTNIFNPPDEKLIYFTYVQCNAVVVVKRGGILLPICWALTAS